MGEAQWSVEDRHMRRAIEAVGRHALRTPLVPAPALGPRVWLKLETAQHTGSFKVRGALARLAALDDAERSRSVVSASAGNHGLGLAFAARRLGVRVRVFVPVGTPLVKREGMAALGAEVVVTDTEGYDAAERLARTFAEESGAVFVSAFDDPWVSAGNGGTLGLEVFERLHDVEGVIAPVGGGGLMTGLAAARARAKSDARLIGVQSEACPAMHRSIEEGRAVLHLRGEPTLAEGLEGGVTPASFAHVRDAVERIDLVSEERIADAMRFAHVSMGLTVEGSAATVIAWAREASEREPGEGSLVLVVTGRNVDEEALRRVLAG